MKRPDILTASADEINAWNESGQTDGTEISLEQMIENIRSFISAWNKSGTALSIKEKTNENA